MSSPSVWPKLLAGVAMLLFGIGVFSLHLPPWAQEMSKEWGPGFFMMVLAGGAAVRWIPKDAIPNFVAAQESQAVALHAISLSLQAISGQAGKLDELKEILREIQLDQRVDAERLKRIEEGWRHAGH